MEVSLIKIEAKENIYSKTLDLTRETIRIWYYHWTYSMNLNASPGYINNEIMKRNNSRYFVE